MIKIYDLIMESLIYIITTVFSDIVNSNIKYNLIDFILNYLSK